jgi:hypothetical protein
VVQRSKIADYIVSTIGFEAATRFFSYYGGKRVKIPDGTGRPGLFVERLIELLGEDGYRKLIARFGGEDISVPKGRAQAMIARNRQIVADYDAGTFSMHDLVRRYDLCERQIRAIINRPAE